VFQNHFICSFGWSACKQGVTHVLISFSALRYVITYPVPCSILIKNKHIPFNKVISVTGVISERKADK